MKRTAKMKTTTTKKTTSKIKTTSRTKMTSKMKITLKMKTFLKIKTTSVLLVYPPRAYTTLVALVFFFKVYSSSFQLSFCPPELKCLGKKSEDRISSFLIKVDEKN